MYDQTDLKKLLNRALEIQKQSGGTDSYFHSIDKLSLEELQEIALDSGLSPEYVKQAAAELEGIPIEEPLFIDTDNRNEVELLGFADGKLDQKTWAELRSIIESEFNSAGIVKRLKEKIVWKAKPEGLFRFLKPAGTPRVEIKKSGFKSEIKINNKLSKYSILQYPAYAGFGGSFMLLTIFFQTSNPAALIFMAGLSGISKLLLSWRDHLKKQSKERLKNVITRLQTIVNRRHSVSEFELQNTSEILYDNEESVNGQKQEKTVSPKKNQARSS